MNYVGTGLYVIFPSWRRVYIYMYIYIYMFIFIYTFTYTVYRHVCESKRYDMYKRVHVTVTVAVAVTSFGHYSRPGHDLALFHAIASATTWADIVRIN